MSFKVNQTQDDLMFLSVELNAKVSRKTENTIKDLESIKSM